MKRKLCVYLLTFCALSASLAATECNEEAPADSINGALSYLYTRLSDATGLSQSSAFFREAERLVDEAFRSLIFTFNSLDHICCSAKGKWSIYRLDDRFLGYILQREFKAAFDEISQIKLLGTQEEAVQLLSENSYYQLQRLFESLAESIAETMNHLFAKEKQSFTSVREHTDRKGPQADSPPTPSQIDPAALHDLEEVPLCL